jgi:4-hydroxy-2-oxoglutarate aldolase
MKMKLQGVIPPLATPFKDQELDLDSVRYNLEKYNQTGLSGYLALGSNGEAAYLNFEEKREFLKVCREMTPKDRILMVGTGCETTRDTIAMCQMAADEGADCVLVLPPNYYKGQMDHAAQLRHYQAVCQASPVPVLYYNMPAAAGMNATPDLVKKLTDIPNFAGIKDSSGNMAQLSEICRLCGDDLRTFVGASPMLYPSLCLGAHGGILAVANAAPKTCVKLFEAHKAGDHAEALRLHRLLFQLAFMVTAGHGVPGLKYAMMHSGFQGGEVRDPLMPISDPEIQARIKEQVELVMQEENA